MKISIDTNFPRNKNMIKGCDHILSIVQQNAGAITPHDPHQNPDQHEQGEHP